MAAAAAATCPFKPHILFRVPNHHARPRPPGAPPSEQLVPRRWRLPKNGLSGLAPAGTPRTCCPSATTATPSATATSWRTAAVGSCAGLGGCAGWGDAALSASFRVTDWRRLLSAASDARWFLTIARRVRYSARARRAGVQRDETTLRARGGGPARAARPGCTTRADARRARTVTQRVFLALGAAAQRLGDGPEQVQPACEERDRADDERDDVGGEGAPEGHERRSAEEEEGAFAEAMAHEAEKASNTED
eukprot:4139443-Prymnesium_polylepis.1